MKKWLVAVILIPGYCHGDMSIIIPSLSIGDVSNSTIARYSLLEFPAGSLDNYATYYVFIATRAVIAGPSPSVQSPTTGFFNTNGFGVGESSAIIVRGLDNTITQGFELLRQSDDIRILGIYQKSGEPYFDSNGLGVNFTAPVVRCSGDLQFSGNLTRNGGNASLSIGSGGSGTKLGMTITNNLTGGSPNTIPLAVAGQIYQAPPLQTWGSTGSIFTVVDGSGSFGIGITTPLAPLEVNGGGIAGFGSSSFTILVTTTIGQYQMAVSSTGHFIVSGGSPIVSACGAAPSGVCIACTDNAGTIQVGGGVTTSCTLTFQTPFASVPGNPSCTVSDNNAAIGTAITALTNSAITFGTATSLAGGKFYYNCFGVRE